MYRLIFEVIHYDDKKRKPTDRNAFDNKGCSEMVPSGILFIIDGYAASPYCRMRELLCFLSMKSYII